MRGCVLVITTVLVTLAGSIEAQTSREANEYNQLLQTYLTVRAGLPATQRANIDGLFSGLLASYGLSSGFSTGSIRARQQVGSLSANRYLPGSTSSPSSRYMYSSPANPYGEYGSAYSTNGARNSYTTGGLDVVGFDGTYLGKLNANRYDPNSIANPYGRYGSPYSSESVNNPYGRFGSPYSPYSAQNPYATQPPSLYQPLGTSGSPGYGLSLPPLPSLPSLPSIWPGGNE